MKTSDQGIALIKAHEGLRLDAYPDPGTGGEPITIGYGHTGGVKLGDRITQEQADQFLRDDLDRFEEAVRQAVKVPINQTQFDAMVSLAFNIGAGAFAKSTLVRKLNAGDTQGAADEFLRWNKAGGRVMAGLSKRRAQERALFLKEAPMAPLLIPLAGALIEAFTPLAKEKLTKEISRHSDKPEVAEQIASGVIEAAKIATGMQDPVQAVAAVKNDPEAMVKTEEAAVASVDQLLPVLERMNKIEQENIRAAREFNAGEPYMVDTPWLRLKFVHLLSLGFVTFSGLFVTEHWASLTSELKGAVITLMVIAGWNGVRDYWMGSSSGSAEKTAMLKGKP